MSIDANDSDGHVPAAADQADFEEVDVLLEAETDAAEVAVLAQAATTEGPDDDSERLDLPGAKTGSTVAVKLSDLEQEAVDGVGKLGFLFAGSGQSMLRFYRPKGLSGGHRPEHAGVPIESVPDLSLQVGAEIVIHPTLSGFMLPGLGYSELVIRPASDAHIFQVERLLKRDNNSSECIHDAARETPRIRPVAHMSRITDSVGRPIGRLHLCDPQGSACLEISNVSPLGALLYSALSPVDGSRMYFRPTVKIDFRKSVSKDSIISATDGLVRSFIYELDVRNGLFLRTQTRSLPREARMLSRSRPATRTHRYPRTRLQPEVAELFNFAGQAVNNPPLAFLSYYQTLEYFVPAAVQQSALKRIRRELRDPVFVPENDDSILRIISATERSVNVPESSQVRTLVTDFVRRDRLEDFFKEEWGDYFTRRGPIQGVSPISINSPEFESQIAERVYQIRNRIVHAKNDPKYKESRVLLPQSGEAQALGPDVQLVRLLAMEAILAGQ